jgi:hypothetical protein
MKPQTAEDIFENIARMNLTSTRSGGRGKRKANPSEVCGASLLINWSKYLNLVI